MMANIMRYTLDDVNKIIFDGFDFNLPDKTLQTISQIALQVGSPDYVKTPVFKKRENPMKVEPSSIQKEGICLKKNKRNKVCEIVSDDDWNAIRTTFQPTKIEEKTGIDTQIDIIRALLNKLTDKNYMDMRNKIIDAFDTILTENVTNEVVLLKTSSTIFDIASTNRFYSKIYADIYSELLTNNEIIKDVLQQNFKNFEYLFNNIEYIDPNENYDKFCEINKINEKRKSLATFYVNLMLNGIITKTEIVIITRNLLAQIYTFISVENKKNEVDELTENIAILYKKDFYEYDNGNNYENIDGYTINEIVQKIANSKVKDYKSLTNKALFKFMDLIEM